MTLAATREDYFTIETPVGVWQVITLGDELSEFEFCPPKHLPKREPQTAFQKKLHKRLTDYLNGKRVEFDDIPLHIQTGAPFHQKVWQQLRKIPHGQTVTYSDIAEQLGSPNAQRAVGGGVGGNPIPLVIPCHRVIGKDGSLRGFMRGHPQGLKIKEFLLTLEQSVS